MALNRWTGNVCSHLTNMQISHESPASPTSNLSPARGRCVCSCDKCRTWSYLFIYLFIINEMLQSDEVARFCGIFSVNTTSTRKNVTQLCVYSYFHRKKDKSSIHNTWKKQRLIKTKALHVAIMNFLNLKCLKFKPSDTTFCWLKLNYRNTNCIVYLFSYMPEIVPSVYNVILPTSMATVTRSNCIQWEGDRQLFNNLTWKHLTIDKHMVFTFIKFDRKPMH